MTLGGVVGADVDAELVPARSRFRLLRSSASKSARRRPVTAASGEVGHAAVLGAGAAANESAALSSASGRRDDGFADDGGQSGGSSRGAKGDCFWVARPESTTVVQFVLRMNAWGGGSKQTLS